MIKLFKKRRKPLGYWLMIGFGDQAKANAVGDYYLKKIYHFYNTRMIFERTENFTEAKIRGYIDREIPVIDATAGQEVPIESQLMPKEQVILGTVQLSRRM